MQKTVKWRRWGAVFAATASLAAISAAFSGCSNSEGYENYENASLYTVGDVSVDAAQIRKVEIDWLGGSIEVEQSSTADVRATEEEYGEREEERMRYYLDDGILRIRYCAPAWRGVTRAQHKNLRVSVPNGVSLEIDCTNALVTVGILEVPRFSLENEKGNFTAERISCDRAEVEMNGGRGAVGELIASNASLETGSGDLTVERLSADFLEAETNSGAFSFGVQNAMQGEIDSRSGNVSLTLAENMGANVRFETAKGKLYTEKAHESKAKSYHFPATEGGALCSVDVETISGDLYIR